MSGDAKLLLDMVQAARRAIAFAGGTTRERLEGDELHLYAILHALTLLGEAAARVSAETRVAHPDVPWKEAIGTRNRLVHEYAGVNLDIVWRIVQDELPRLVARLAPLLPSEEEM